MKWQTVESSQIAELGYEEESQTLGVKFKPFKGDGPLTEYVYLNVPFRVYRALLAAKDDPKSSIGRYFDLNIKKHPELYPYEKIGIVSTNGVAGEVVENPGSALAKIDKLTADAIFVPNALDSILITVREEALAEAKKYDISTPEKRKGLKSLAFKLVKTRTFIEGLAKAHTIETKRKLANIDSEKRRLCDIIQGIEDEVRSPLTEWENKEKARVQAHEDAIAAIKESPNYGATESVAELENRLAWLDGQLTRDWEEWRVAAELAITEETERTRGLLEAAKTRDAEKVELERLRAESAKRAEQDRIAEQQRQENERIAAAVEAAKQATREEVITELTAKPNMAHVSEVAEYAEPDSPVLLDTKPRDLFAVYTSAPTRTHAEKIEGEAIAAIVANGFPAHVAANLIAVIAKRLIPHITITY